MKEIIENGKFYSSLKSFNFQELLKDVTIYLSNKQSIYRNETDNRFENTNNKTYNPNNNVNSLFNVGNYINSGIVSNTNLINSTNNNTNIKKDYKTIFPKAISFLRTNASKKLRDTKNESFDQLLKQKQVNHVSIFNLSSLIKLIILNYIIL